MVISRRMRLRARTNSSNVRKRDSEETVLFDITCRVGEPVFVFPCMTRYATYFEAKALEITGECWRSCANVYDLIILALIRSMLQKLIYSFTLRLVLLAVY